MERVARRTLPRKYQEWHDGSRCVELHESRERVFEKGGREGAIKRCRCRKCRLWKQDCTCTAGEVKPRCIIAGRACQMHHCKNRASTDVLKCLRQYCCGETGRYKEVSVNWNTQQKHNKGTDTSYPGLCSIKNGIVRNKPSPRTLPPAAPPGRRCPESARFVPKSD